MRKMKDSGIEWIGEIQESWEIVPLSKLSKRMNNGYVGPTRGLFVDDGVRYLQSLHIKNGEIFFEKSPYYVTEDWAKEHSTGTVHTNDVLIVQTGDIGQIAYVSNEFDGCNCHALIIVTPQEQICQGEYLSFLLQGHYAHHQLQMRKTGALHPHLNCGDIKDIKLPIPPLEIQTKLVSYMKDKTREIDSIIAAKEKTNELLKERRQSIIYEAVTKGLDPTVPMKDSGVERIGEIPESWITTRIKYTSTLKGRIGWQGLKSDEYIDEGPYLITGVDFVNGRIDWENCAHISSERYEEAPEIHIFEGDLLITKDGTIGKLAIAENCPNEVSLNSGVLLIRNNERGEYLNKYLYYVLQSDVFWKWFKLSQNGNSTIIHLYQEQFSNFRYALPSIKEQQVIVDFLDNGCSELESLISANESTIEKLKEYRQSVIYEAVTGKVEI